MPAHRRRPAAPAGALKLGAPGLPDFQGAVYQRGDGKYMEKAEQYATSSLGRDGSMEPAAIIYAKGDDDVIAAIKYARDNGLAVAVRTGGHQYTGASSTFGRNVQLDMSEAYTEPIDYNKDTGLVTVGISRRLAQLNRELHAKGLFVPHGQCSHVHVGGHAHTGGYGLPGRAFGLFSDHIAEARVITADGQARWLSRDATDPSEADLFYAVLGGSPGNYGVLTHIRLAARRDEDHPDSRGLKMFGVYTQSAVARLLQIKAEMADDVTLPRDFDFCVTVISIDLLKRVPDNDVVLPPASRGGRGFGPRAGADDGDDDDDALSGFDELLGKFDVDKADIRGFLADLKKRDLRAEDLPGPAVIFVWAEWANTDKGEAYDEVTHGKWFDRLRDAMPGVARIEIDNREHTPMSELTFAWTYKIKREFNLPYVKRTCLTNSTTLSKSGWAEYAAGQIDKVVDNFANGLRVVVQIQHYGGEESRYTTNDPEDRTSYSWRRDTTVVQTLDCFFYDKHPVTRQQLSRPRQMAHAWQQENDIGLLGPDGCFAPSMDRRVLWGSFHTDNPLNDGSDMQNAWPFYHESYEKYLRLAAIKARVDPKGVFTPNQFTVRPPQVRGA